MYNYQLPFSNLIRQKGKRQHNYEKQNLPIISRFEPFHHVIPEEILASKALRACAFYVTEILKKETHLQFN